VANIFCQTLPVASLLRRIHFPGFLLGPALLGEQGLTQQILQVFPVEVDQSFVGFHLEDFYVTLTLGV
jgi:hypothetical protein